MHGRRFATGLWLPSGSAEAHGAGRAQPEASIDWRTVRQGGKIFALGRIGAGWKGCRRAARASVPVTITSRVGRAPDGLFVETAPATRTVLGTVTFQEFSRAGHRSRRTNFRTATVRNTTSGAGSARRPTTPYAVGAAQSRAQRARGRKIEAGNSRERSCEAHPSRDSRNTTPHHAYPTTSAPDCCKPEKQT
jgi:hypothetical protein